MEPRTIFHVDMDAFFASVEIVLNPSLKGKPLIIGGSPEQRGVVSTCSYEARAYGVHSAMSMYEATRRCPHAIFMRGNFEHYRDFSDRVMEILFELTYKVEVVGIDEAYVDISEIPLPAMEVGKKLRRDVLDRTGLTCSIGIASNKLVAKTASSIAKPNGLYEIPAGLEAAFLASLPIGKIYGIGPKTAEYFYQDGIETIADLQALSMDEMIFRYGQRGYHYYHLIRGCDNRPVCWEEEAPKQVGAETTFEKDLSDREQILEKLDYVVKKAYKRLEREEMLVRGVTLKLRDADFHTITRSHTFPAHTKDYQTLKEASELLFNCSWPEGQPLRLIGVAFEKLTDSYWQPLLWPWESGLTT